MESTESGTTDLERKESRIEAPDYDPQAVQPDNGPQLSEAKIRKAVNIGLTDQRLENFLRQNNFKVSEVQRLKPFYQGGNTSKKAHLEARVTVVLDDPIPLDQSGYKGGVCDFGGASGPVTGLVWVADLVDQRISVNSPLWNYKDSCV